MSKLGILLEKSGKTGRKIIFSRLVILSALFFTIFSEPLHALEKVQIQDVSGSRKTMVVNRGRLDGINSGMEAFFLKSINEEDLKKSLVGVAEVVKVFDRYSVWYFKKSLNPSYLAPKNFIDMITYKDLNRKKAPFKLRTRKVISGSVSQDEKILLHDSGSDISTVKRNKNYRLGQVLKDLDDPKDFKDLNILELSKWVERKKKVVGERDLSETEAFAVKYSTAPDLEDTVKKLQKKEATEAALAFLKKTGSRDFTVKTFFEDQEKNADAKDFQKDSYLHSVSKKRNYQNRRKKINKEKLIKQLKNRGIDWSEDYSDEELITMVNSYGLIKENARQVDAIQTLISREVSIHVSVNISGGGGSANSSSDEISGTPTNLGVAYEHMWIRNNPKLQKFSTEIGFFTGNRNYDLAGLVKTTESYGRLFGQYYLQQGPARINAFLPYIGLGLKVGNVSTSLEGFEASYSLFSTMFGGGVKYRFGPKFGFRGQLAYVSNQLSRSGSDTTELLKSGTFNTVEAELSLSYYF